MPTNAVLYRKRTKEVVKIAIPNRDGVLQIFPKLVGPNKPFAVAFDVNLPDGRFTRDHSSPVLGPERQLGWAKIYVPSTNTARNATQAEIDTFSAGENADEEAEHTVRLRQQLKNDPHYRRIFKIFARLLNKTRVDASLPAMSDAELAAFIDANILETD